jgi:hypothetical protein
MSKHVFRKKAKNAAVFLSMETIVSFAAITGIAFAGIATGAYVPHASVISEAMAQAQQTAQVNTTLVGRVALRLERRLRAQQRPVAPAAKLQSAVTQRQALLGSRVTVTYQRESGLQETWNATPQAYPLWIKGTFTQDTAAFELDSESIRTTIHDTVGAHLIAPQDTVLEAVEEREGGVLRARTTGVAKPGEVLDEATAAQAVTSALLAGGSGSLVIPIDHVPGQVENRSDRDIGPLTFLAEGKSNFKGSGWGRIQNVRKALRDHVNNTIVAPGETYSFNKMLEGPVTTGNGWYMAKVIENGIDLVDAPGGGICQTSTTMFRAMLNAGFTPVEREAHSLYVTYYEQYGVGIDATIFPGKQDLTFVNDTDSYLLVQAYEDGFDAYVNIYGKDDGREVDLQGPFFASTAHMSSTDLSGLHHNEIAWVHKVRYSDGRETENIVRSQYRAIPRTLAQKYTLHASAGEQGNQ